MVMYAMTNLQFQAVYNTLLYLLASMMATTIYLWFRSFLVKDKFQSAVIIIGLGKHMILQGDVRMLTFDRQMHIKKHKMSKRQSDANRK